MNAAASTEVRPLAELCVVHGRASTAEGVLRELSELALSHGFVRDGHADALVEREAAYPTGLPMPVPVAIPHTDAGWVLRPALAAYVPLQPVQFGEMGSSDRTVSARLVLMLAVDDPAAQVPLLGRVLTGLRSPDLEERVLAGVTDPGDLAARLEDLLAH